MVLQQVSRRQAGGVRATRFCPSAAGRYTAKARTPARKVYEVDPLRCPSCGGSMKVTALVESSRQPEVVEKILRHCGPWREPAQRALPQTPHQPQPRGKTRAA